jgi:hypothetical protein
MRKPMLLGLAWTCILALAVLSAYQQSLPIQ